ncbi:MAG: ROK family protein [Spirochaetaceae bacterium]
MKKKLLCGVDFGGTKLAVGLVTPEEGRLIDKTIRYDHLGISEKETMKIIAETIKSLLKKNDLLEEDLIGIGVGFTGHISYPAGKCITSSNIEGFDGFSLKDELDKYFNIPIVIDNDANAQACGEHSFGAGKGISDILYITISTGIGAGIFIDNKLVHGKTGTAGEIGHTIMNPDSGALCNCGNYGCVMAEASSLGLPYQYSKEFERQNQITGHQLLDPSEGKKIDGVFLRQQVEAGDISAINVMKHSARYVGILIYNMFQTLNPELIILGGGFMNLGDTYMNQIRDNFYKYAGKMMVNKTEVVYEQLKSNSGLIGAASLVKCC